MNIRSILAVLLMAISFSASSQTMLGAESKTPTGKYVSAGISVSQGDASTAGQFNTNSFFWGEFGITRNNVGIGLNFGRSNFRFDEANDEFTNLYLEPKVTATLVEKGFAKGYVLFGAGVYPRRLSYSKDELIIGEPIIGKDLDFMSQYFIEYGAGTTFSFGMTDLSVQWSNWDGWNYVSMGLTRNF